MTQLSLTDQLSAPLTPNQRDHFLNIQRHPEDTTLNLAVSIILPEQVDPKRWQKALEYIIEGQSIFRTLFAIRAGKPYQYFSATCPISFNFQSHPDWNEADIRAFIEKIRSIPLDCQSGPLFKFFHLQTREGDVAAVVASPLVMDELTAIAINEAAWSNYCNQHTIQTSEPDTEDHFFRYAQQDFSHFDTPETNKFWRKQLSHTVPFNSNPSPLSNVGHRRSSLDICSEDTAKIRSWCQSNGCNLPNFFMGLYVILLQRCFDHTSDFVIRSVLTSRPDRFKRTLGCFYQIVPYIFPAQLWEEKTTVSDVVHHSKAMLTHLGQNRDISAQLLNSILQNETIKPFFNFPAYAENLIFGAHRVTTFISNQQDEIHLRVTDLEDAIGLELHYHESSFPDSRFLERFVSLAKQVVAGTTSPGQLTTLLADELIQYEDPIAQKPFVPIHTDFESWAERQPDAIAIRFQGETITYAECNRRANQLTRDLTAMGVSPHDPVGICLPPSPDQVITLLAILKLGAWYIPIDPVYPSQRKQFMLNDSGVKVVVTSRLLAAQFEGMNLTLLYLQENKTVSPTPQNENNPQPEVQPDDTAYVIYTSGTTGQSKGVVVSHQNVQNLFEATSAEFRFTNQDIWTLFHSIAFDFSVWEIWGALRHGGCLVVVPDTIRHDPRQFFQLIERYHVTILNQTPAAFYALIRENKHEFHPASSLRLVIFGGEALNISRLRPWFEHYGEEKPLLVNMYGITETTVHVTWRPLSKKDATRGSASLIGTPIPGWRLHILDHACRPMPPGWPGELYVGGTGITKGYLNRPNLTTRKFVTDPFIATPKTRLFRSGDLARWMPGKHDIEYLGRTDMQVKIRGYRLELGEIESTLLRHPGIHDVAVITSPDPADPDLNRLIAYIVFTEEPVAVYHLREHLLKDLPPYMVPAIFTVLKCLPLTPHGKLDRSKLPIPQFAVHEAKDSYLLPRNIAEQTLVEVWRELLNIEKVGIYDNFFECGGNSLSATQLAGRIRDSFGCDLPLCNIFEKPTIAELAPLISNAEKSKIPPLEKTSREHPIPLSFSQERVWFLQKMYPENRAYQFYSTLHFRGDLNIEVLRQTLTEIVHRHEIYRTTFVEIDGLPQQIIHSHYEIDLSFVDLNENATISKSRQIKKVIQAQSSLPFSFDRLPLVRWTLIQLGEQEHILFHAEHHIIHDGWSFVVFLEELTKLYSTFLSGQRAPQPDTELQFADFSCWQRYWMNGPVGKKQLEYWKNQLKDAPVEIELPYDHPRPSRQTFNGHALRLDFSKQMVQSLESFARSQDVTLNMILLASFQALLARYTGQYDIVVGSGVANRRVRETEFLMGMLLNNVVLRTDLSGDPTFEEILRRVKQVTIGAIDNQDVPFDRVVEAVNPPRRPDLPPLFHILFTSYDGTYPSLQLPGVEIQLEEGLNTGSSKFDLNVIAISRVRNPSGMCSAKEAVPTDSQSHRSILLIWEYNSDLFEVATMERMLGHFRTILVSATDNPSQKLSELKLMSVEEERWLSTAGKGKETLYPRDTCIHEVFSKQAMLTPEMVALRFLGQEMSYRELDERSNQLARHLKKCGVGLDTHVGICLERSFEMIIGIIGILKAGGAYVPLDHSYPKERIDFIRNDTRAAVVVTHTKLAEKFAFPLKHTLCLDAPPTAFDHESTAYIKPSGSPENLAYIIYTSGSTGLPKGVRVVHRGVVRLVKETDYVDLNPDHRFLQYAPISFDAASFEIFGALLNGATLVIAPPGLVSFSEFGRFTKNENITTVWLTAPLFHQMVDHALPSFANIQQLLVGGDILSPNHVARFLRQYPDICLINGYGPTEGTTFTCCHKMTGSYPSGKTIPIGKPIANTQVYILDGHGCPVPIGVKGELYIGGDGLARDYFERPDLTTAQFVVDTVSGKHNKRLYKTGDWGRFLADGTIEFLGRTDHQVKIRGFRVEPGEIESVLRRHHDIGDAVVTVDDSSPEYSRLIAYVIPAGDIVPEEKHIQNFLREKCPPHMIPYRCFIIPAFPLTSNGKINRSALPKPGPITPKKRTQLQSVDEWRMSEIWSELLGVEIVDAQDNFFDQGGHSLLGLQLVSRINKTFGVECPLSILFEAPTVRGLVKWLQRTQSKLSTKSGQPRYDSHVKCLQHGKGKPPLFWVPGGWGSENELVVYARIMRHMGDDLPFYGFLAHGIDGITRPITQVRRMAAAYISEMKKIQSSGPYYLAGECRGGVVAYEMAQQLRDSRDTVAFLALVDTAFPHRMAFIKNLCMQLYRRMREGIHGIRHHSKGQRFHCTLLELANILQFIGDRIGWVPSNSTLENEKARIKFRYRVGETIYRQTLQRYKPKPYTGNVRLVLSSQTHQSANLWKGWLDCVQGEVEIKVMPGDHESYIRDHAKEMGKELRYLLECQWQLQ